MHDRLCEGCVSRTKREKDIRMRRTLSSGWYLIVRRSDPLIYSFPQDALGPLFEKIWRISWKEKIGLQMWQTEVTINEKRCLLIHTGDLHTDIAYRLYSISGQISTGICVQNRHCLTVLPKILIQNNFEIFFQLFGPF